MAKGWVDLSWTVSQETLVYPGDPDIEFREFRSHQNDGFRLGTLSSAMHVGTHLDAPLHFIAEGTPVDRIPIERFLGNASKLVIEPDHGVLTTKRIRSAYAALDDPEIFLLLQTGHDRIYGNTAYFTACPAFEPDLIDFLREKKITLLGLDLPTIQYVGAGPKPAHLDLLGEGIVIVENLAHLNEVSDHVELIALPLKLKGMDGSMVRAVARDR